MPKFNRNRESQEKEEFDLNVICVEKNQDRNQIEKDPGKDVCRKYWFVPTEKSSPTESNKRRSYSQQQQIDTSTKELHSSEKNDNTKNEYPYSDDRISFGSQRICRISKKTWLLVQRITLITAVSSLVLVANIGTIFIHLKDVIRRSYPGLAELLALTKSINSSRQNSSLAVLVPDIDAANIRNDIMIDSKSSKKLFLPDCFESFDEWNDVLFNIRFALESVTLNIFGFLGLLANVIVIFALVRITMNKRLHGNHKNFDRLVICLSVIDILLIVFHVVDALVQIDLLSEPTWYQVLYPHFWYPMKIIMTTASQYMVVAISVERYIAICHKFVVPPKYIKILFWVVTFSLVVNLPRFCEFISHHVPSSKTEDPLSIIIERSDDDQFSLQYHTSRLGENPEWLLFISCHEIVVIIFCLGTICFCNFNVWIQVLGSTKLNIQRHIGTLKSSPTNKFRSQSLTKSLNQNENLGMKRKKFLTLQVDLHVEDEAKLTSTLTDSIEGGLQSKHEMEISTDHKLYHSERAKKVESNGTIHTDFQNINTPTKIITPKDEADVIDSKTTEVVENDQFSRQNEINSLELDGKSLVTSSQSRTSVAHLKSSGEVSIHIFKRSESHVEQMKQEYSKNLNNFQELEPHHSSKGFTATSPDDDGTKEHFQKAHIKSTLILFSIAAIFLLCNIPRLAVKIFHVYLQGRSVQKHYNECAAAGQFHAPVGILIMSYVNHLLLVLNSSTNFIIYCCFAKRFRAEIVRITNLFRKY